MSKRCQQIPGVNYLESFSPVATNTSVRIVLALTLFYQDKGWKCSIIDIEAAFLEGMIETPTYLEWPEGIDKLGFKTSEERKTMCIKQLKSIYGNIDATLHFYQTFSNHLVNNIKIICSSSDPYIFIWKDDNYQQTMIMATIYINDMLICGP